MKSSRLALIPILCGVAGLGRVEGGGGPAKPAPSNLRSSRIDDRAMAVSLPLSKGGAVSLALEEHWWIKASPPTSIHGNGVVLYCVPSFDSASVDTRLYVGSIELAAPKQGEAPADVRRRSATEFVAGLEETLKLGRMSLVSSLDKIRLVERNVKLGGKKTDVLQSALFNSKPLTGYSDNPSFVYTDQLAFVPSPAGDRLVYLLVAMSRGSPSLDALLAGITFTEPAARLKGATLKFMDDTIDAHGKFVSRFANMDGPGGFDLDFEAQAKAGGLWSAARRDASDQTNATLVLTRREPGLGGAASPAEEGDITMKLLGVESPGTPKKAELATKGLTAIVHAYKTKIDEKDCAASTAVFRVEDQIWTLSWSTFGDDALAKADASAFERLLRSFQVAVR